MKTAKTKKAAAKKTRAARAAKPSVARKAAPAKRPLARKSKPAKAQPAKPAAPPEIGEKLTFNHAMIYAKDVERSMRFYLDMMGFKLVEDFRYEGTPVYA